MSNLTDTANQATSNKRKSTVAIGGEAEVSTEGDIFGGDKTIYGPESSATGGGGGRASSTTNVNVTNVSAVPYLIGGLVFLVIGIFVGLMLSNFFSNNSLILQATPSPTVLESVLVPTSTPTISTGMSASNRYFKVSFDNTLEKGSYTYEITDHLQSAKPQGLDTNVKIRVEPTYKDSENWGQVNIFVKDKENQILARAGWENFDKNAQPIEISIDPYKLAPQVQSAFPLKANVLDSYEPSEETFLIEAVAVDRKPTYSEVIGTLALRNTPWYHVSKLSAYAVVDGKPPTLYIAGMNQGETSLFDVGVEIFKVKDIAGNWWRPSPDAQSWDRKAIIIVPIGRVEGGSKFFKTIDLPADAFQDSDARGYVLNSWVVKRQKYVPWSDADWLDTKNPQWQFADDGELLLIQK